MIINKFDSNVLLNDYLSYTLKHPQIIRIDTVAKHYVYSTQDFALLRQLVNKEVDAERFNEIVVETMESNNVFDQYTQSFYSLSSFVYVFPWSKTTYRKTVHPNIVDSTYKRLYGLLKNVDYIVDATGSCVTISPCVVSEEKFSAFLGELNTFTEKSLQSVIGYIQEISSDHSYYIQVIESLENKVKDLEQQNNELSLQLTNKSLTTWY